MIRVKHPFRTDSGDFITHNLLVDKMENYLMR